VQRDHGLTRRIGRWARSGAFRGAHLKRVRSALMANGSFSFTYVLTVFVI